MSETTIPSGELLWRTRGKHWEYCFLMTPNLNRDSWWRFYREVKAEMELSPDGDQVIGHLKDRAGQQHLYLASTFLDSELVDQAGRATEQFVVWFPSEQNLEKEKFPANLAKTVSNHFAAIINSNELSQLTDADETSPETVFQQIRQHAGDIAINQVSSESPSPRTIDIYHQPDGDLAVVEPKKRSVVPIVILIIFVVLLGASLMVYLKR